MNEKDLLIYLNLIRGVGWKTVDRLVSHLETLEQILLLSSIEITMKTGVDFAIAQKIEAELKQDKFEQYFLLKKQWEDRAIKTITIKDKLYPALLKEIYQPPWVLYAIGNHELLSSYSIAIVGTRTPTHYGKIAAEKLTKELVQGNMVIVSGMARGVDRIAHQTAIEQKGSSIAVLGSGIDIIYPKENQEVYYKLKEDGLILSEYSPGTAPHPGYFPQRNRIISGISLGTLIIEASEKSGSLITAQFALEQSREVFALPGPITSKQSIGTNTLIKQGAKLVQGAEDIFEEFGYIERNPSSTPVQIELSEFEKQLLSFIEDIPIHINELYQKVNFDLSNLYETLLALQLKKMIKQLPGNEYIRSS